ncbi:permease [Cohnella nanjingensis]|uniref:Permease n=1 Tax=Cohnella nanjingensis TaxID=1387779 RepID=A0A7X0VF43_9BACL|nr:permease [Cohnella nanjingensis]MBB6670898.1 permease [Cohnella nanjingensis]
MSVTWMRLGTGMAGAGCLYMMWKLNASWPLSFVSVFFEIVFDALPFLLLGAFASALLETFVSDRYVQTLAPKNRLGGVLFGSLLGLALPLCECGMIPVARRLIRKGLPAYIGIAYIVAGPIVNPIVFGSTIVAFRADPAIAYARVLLALAVALTAGLLLALCLKRSPLRDSIGASAGAAHAHSHHGHGAHGHAHPHDHDAHGHANGHEHDHDHDGHGHAHRHHDHDGHGHAHGHHGHSHASSGSKGRFASVVSHTAEDMWDMGKYLLLGAALTGIVQSIVQPETMIAAAGHTAWSHVFMMGFAYLLSLCSTSDAFVAASLSPIFHPGALLAFLVFGPMLDLKSTLMMLSVFRRGFVWKFAVLLAVLVLAGSLAVERWGML